jgi:hypothetical protein
MTRELALRDNVSRRARARRVQCAARAPRLVVLAEYRAALRKRQANALVWPADCRVLRRHDELALDALTLRSNRARESLSRDEGFLENPLIIRDDVPSLRLRRHPQAAKGAVMSRFEFDPHPSIAPTSAPMQKLGQGVENVG